MFGDVFAPRALTVPARLQEAVPCLLVLVTALTRRERRVDAMVAMRALRVNAGDVRQNRRSSGSPNAARTSASPTPATSTALWRLVSPRTTRTAPFGTPSAWATTAHAAAFAFPPSGGAVTRTDSSPPRQPATSSRPDLGVT